MKLSDTSCDPPDSTNRNEPTEQEMAWYREWAINLRSPFAIATEADVKLSVVHATLQRVASWMKAQVYQDTTALRMRQTELLSSAAEVVFKKWQEDHVLANLEAVRKLFSDVRDMWGVDRPEAVKDVHPEEEGLPRVAGMTRREAILKQIAIMQAAADSC